jgi:hypothetical protein
LYLSLFTLFKITFPVGFLFQYQVMDPNQKRIIELAAQEGHDADIPSNAGRVIGDGEKVVTSPTTVASTASDFDKDIEKDAVSKHGSNASSPAGSTIEKQGPGAEVEMEEHDPNIVFWDGPDDPENPMVQPPFSSRYI